MVFGDACVGVVSQTRWHSGWKENQFWKKKIETMKNDITYLRGGQSRKRTLECKGNGSREPGDKEQLQSLHCFWVGGAFGGY